MSTNVTINNSTTCECDRGISIRLEAMENQLSGILASLQEIIKKENKILSLQEQYKSAIASLAAATNVVAANNTAIATNLTVIATRLGTLADAVKNAGMPEDVEASLLAQITDLQTHAQLNADASTQNSTASAGLANDPTNPVPEPLPPPPPVTPAEPPPPPPPEESN